jgi:hypothetical protein
MSVKEYLGSMTLAELEYARLMLEIDPKMTVLQMIKIIKERREDARK